MTEDFVAAANWLKSHADSTDRLGAVGFCFGGGIVNTLAVRMPDLAAAVPFYGSAPAAADVANINAAVLVHHGEMDARLVGAWPEYEAALQANHRAIRGVRLSQRPARVPQRHHAALRRSGRHAGLATHAGVVQHPPQSWLGCRVLGTRSS